MRVFNLSKKRKRRKEGKKKERKKWLEGRRLLYRSARDEEPLATYHSADIRLIRWHWQAWKYPGALSAIYKG